MKKLQLLLTTLLFVSMGVFSNAAALTLLDTESGLYYDDEATAIGGLVGQLDGVDKFYTGTSYEVIDADANSYNYDEEDIQNVINNYYNSTDYIIDGNIKNDNPAAQTTGTIIFDDSWEFLSLKWAAGSGGWFVWNVTDLTSIEGEKYFEFSGLAHDLSHYNLWTVTGTFPVLPPGAVAPIPEPAAMLLLGFGLIGLTGVVRKTMKK